jgi:hypothetical protein
MRSFMDGPPPVIYTLGRGPGKEERGKDERIKD